MLIESLIHFASGAIAGTAGTAITYPLEVIKTRVQSSSGFRLHSDSIAEKMTRSGDGGKSTVLKYIRNIIRHEGISALYKGLPLDLLGVIPSKAVYFGTYSISKRFLNESNLLGQNTASVHMLSAATAGAVTVTLGAPLWLVMVRLQLHQGPLTIRDCIKRVYTKEGVRGFYRGVSASYLGISETMIHFVIYEYLRSLVKSPTAIENNDEPMRLLRFMAAGGTAKMVACSLTYPIAVVRTRLREENSLMRGFLPTLLHVGRQGMRAMYRGLLIQLVKTVPSTAITMGTYELSVWLLNECADK